MGYQTYTYRKIRTTEKDLLILLKSVQGLS